MIEFEVMIHPAKALQALGEGMGTGSDHTDRTEKGREGLLRGPFSMLFGLLPRLRERGPCGKDRPAL
jgi:hypothetical protein